MMLARSILAVDPRTDNLPDMLDNYTAALEDWLKDNPDLRSGQIGCGDATVLQELVDLHSQVIELAKAAQDETSSQMRTLHKKGRGILAYTDVFPKHMSTFRTRKG